ncbi:protein kinase [Cystoisospora suis]|uniref:Protein kinase n=1 Tax=Cystoisospora suis TaxID=483139 RepID=A0A2C6KW68_9APIC|nr:protein kinase [Cystoisospora suis]
MALCSRVSTRISTSLVCSLPQSRLLGFSTRRYLSASLSRCVSSTGQKEEEIPGKSPSSPAGEREPGSKSMTPLSACLRPSRVFLSRHASSTSLFQQSRRGFAAGSYWALNKERLYDDSMLDEWRERFPNLRKYNNDALQTWRRVFDSFDSDRDGFITQADLQKTPEFTVAKAQKLKGEKENLNRELYTEYDADQNNMIDFGEFVEAMYNVDKEMFLESFEGFDPVDVQLEFDKYAVVDEASPTKKQIPQNRVKQMMIDYRFTCVTEIDAQRLFDEMDVNRDGVIDLGDFKQCVQRRS